MGTHEVDERLREGREHRFHRILQTMLIMLMLIIILIIVIAMAWVVCDRCWMRVSAGNLKVVSYVHMRLI